MSTSNKYHISPYLHGGLGNQLFEVAAAYSFCLDNDCKLVINDSKKVSPGHKQNVNKNYESLPTTVCKMFPNIPCVKDRFVWDTIVKQKRTLWYDNLPLRYYLRKNENIILLGVFASYMYFKGHDEEIRKLFTFSNDIKTVTEKKFDNIITNPKTISLHFRRGDRYQSLIKKRKFLCIVSLDYYYKAIDEFLKDHSGYTFVIFSERKDRNYIVDDIIPYLESKNQKYVMVDYAVPASVSLYLMSLCKNNIIGNSTFGFWGAFLNKNKNKIVYFPDVKNTIKDPFQEAITLRGNILSSKREEKVPSNWVKIKTTCVKTPRTSR